MADKLIVMVEGEEFPLSASHYQKALSDANQIKLPFLRVWDMCSLFLQGKQHLRYNRTLKHYVGEKQSPKRQQVTINMILNIYRNMLARLSMAYPSMTVLPAGDSVEDIVKAQASETALRWYWHSAEMRDVLTKMIEWLLICGNAGLHSYYDPEEKLIKTEAISPYDLFFEPGAISSEESRWCAIRHIVHRRDLQKSYPEYAEFIASAKTELNTMTSQMQKNVSATQGYDLKNRVEVFEVYHKDGYTGLLLADRWLYKGRWPDGIMPLQFVNYTRMPGRLWGVGLVEPLLELQVLYNRGRAQIVENAELMGNPKWLVPKSAGLSKNALSSSRPGEKVMYNANSGPAPQQIAAAPIPQYVVNNIKQISAEMMDVAGIHSTSLGKRAIGIESGAAIEALSGKDMQQLQVTQDNIERTVRNTAEIVLGLMRTFYKEKRMMRILDHTGQVVFKELQATDLQGDADIFLEAGSLFRDEKPDRDKRIMDLLQLQLIDRETALDELHFKTGNAFITEKMRGLSHAKEMLEAVTRNHQIEIMPTDDLKSFEKVFSEYIQTEAYYELDIETQQYIRDILIAVTTFGQQDEAHMEKMMRRTVFPRMFKDQGAALDAMSAAGSDNTARQIAGAYDSVADRRSLQEGDPSPEQGIARNPMGGLG